VTDPPEVATSSPLSRSALRPFVSRLIQMAFLPLLASCAAEVEVPPEPSAVPELTRTFLGSTIGGPLPTARLERIGEIRLDFPDDLPRPRAWQEMALTEDSIFLAEAFTQTVWQFDRGGRFVRRLRELESPAEVIDRVEDLHFSPIHGRLFVAGYSGVFVFGPDGAFERRLPKPPFAFSLAETSKGTLLINASQREGPFWAAVDPDDTNGEPRPFCLLRRRLLPPGKDWLDGPVPHSRAEIDSEGNIYVVSSGIREIRKFAPDLQYRGDFRMQEDPNLVPPPEKLSPEQEEEMRFGRRPIFSIVFQVALAARQYLILQYFVPGSKEARLHFYHLDGTPAFAEVWWRPPLLGADVDGRLVALRRRDIGILDLYELGSDAQ